MLGSSCPCSEVDVEFSKHKQKWELKSTAAQDIDASNCSEQRSADLYFQAK